MNILAIESSADETACAIVKEGTIILSNVIASSAQMNKKYGGIVPEIAARNQLEYILPVVTEALLPLSSGQNNNSQKLSTTVLHSTVVDTDNQLLPIIEKSVDAIAVTIGPGLIGSLLIGVETAKTIAFVTKKPIIPVNHVLAHMYANFIPSAVEGENSSRGVTTTRDNNNEIQFPAISLVVSGGHTELYLMKSEKDLQWLGGTLDDAAGECFDKTARLLGFGTGGGVAIQEAAIKFTVHGSRFTVKLPRPMMHEDNLNYSFSGLKTAAMREWKKYSTASQLTTHNSQLVNAFAYEVQEAITDVLVKKTLKAAQMHDAKSILLSGGVSANLRLREKMSSTIEQYNNKTIEKNPHQLLNLHYPPIPLCTDNAVYIASYAFFRGNPEDWHIINAQPDLSVDTL